MNVRTLLRKMIHSNKARIYIGAAEPLDTTVVDAIVTYGEKEVEMFWTSRGVVSIIIEPE